MISMLISCAALLPATAQKGWFVEVGGGVQTIFSKDAGKLDFGKRLTPSYNIGVGKWLSPSYGIRLQVGGYALNGMSTPEGLYLRDPVSDGRVWGMHDPVTNHVTVNADGSYRHYLRYVNAHADFMVSLASVLCSKPGRFDVVPAVGIGYAHAFPYRGTAATNALTANFSLTAKYSVMRCLDVNLEIGSALMPDHFDGRVTGRKYEPTLGASIGLTYRFKTRKADSSGKTSRRKDKAVADTVYMVERIIERPVFKDRVVEKEVKVKAEPFRIASINFNYASANPQKGQNVSFANIVDYLRKNPAARVRLDGYADKATGRAQTNLMLSIRRTDAVRNTLIEKYGIDPSRIEAQGIGCNAQPYDVNEQNRVVIVMALPE